MKKLLILLAILSFGLPAPLALAQPAATSDTVANSGYWVQVYDPDLKKWVWAWVSC